MKTASLPASAGSAWPLSHRVTCCYHKEQLASANISLPFVVFHSTLLCTSLLISVYHFLSDNCFSAHTSSFSTAVFQHDNSQITKPNSSWSVLSWSCWRVLNYLVTALSMVLLFVSQLALQRFLNKIQKFDHLIFLKFSFLELIKHINI